MMKIALERVPKGRWFSRGKWLDLGIAAFSGFGPYCHGELVFSNGECFSSTTRDIWDGNDDAGAFQRTGGLRFRFIDFASPDRRWDLFDLPEYDFDMEDDVRFWCERACDERAARYDYGGVLAFVNPFASEDPDKWFCTEAVMAALELQYDGPGSPTYLNAPACWQALRDMGFDLERPAYRYSPNRIGQVLAGRRVPA